MNRWSYLPRLFSDLRFAARSLRRSLLAPVSDWSIWAVSAGSTWHRTSSCGSSEHASRVNLAMFYGYDPTLTRAPSFQVLALIGAKWTSFGPPDWTGF